MANLLDEASILLTATAYNNGKMLAVKPSENLYGTEEITNGDFATDSDWIKSPNGVTISGGNANFTSGQDTYVFQDIMVIGKKYFIELEYNISSITGSAYFGSNGGSGTSVLDMTNLTGSGTLSGTIIASASKIIVRSSTFSGTVTNVSVKEDLSGDFTFSRNSAATRVNAQGLVENVQILSSNLVSNGDFSQEGSQLILNPNFNDNTWWVVESPAVEISNGKANFNTLLQNWGIYKNNTLTSGKQYKVLFTIDSYTSGGVHLNIGGGVVGSYTAIGTYTAYVTGGGTNVFAIQSDSGGAILSIDNVSVKEVGQDWTLGTGWSIGDNKIIHSSGTGSASRLQQSGFNNTSLYKITITTTNKGSNTYRFYNGAGANVIILEGTNTYLVTGLLVGLLIIEPITHSSGDVEFTNISILEITDDTNLPRIDYTDGCGSLLLEPQSTNLVTYSEDFSQWSKLNGGTGALPILTSDDIISPDGTQNADKIVFNKGASSSNSDFSLIRLNYGGVDIDGVSSVYLKSNVAVDIEISANDVSYTTVNVTTEWQRFTVSDAASDRLSIGLRGTSPSNNTATIYAWGAQLEQGSYATSYIPTQGASSTRLQDIATNSGNASLINSEEGVLYAETKASVHNGNITLSNGSNSNNLIINFNLSSGRIDCNMRVGGAYQFIFNYTTDMSINNKIAVRYKANDFALFVNGIKVLTDTSGITPAINTLNEINFASANTASNLFYGKTKALAVYKTALTDEQLTLLTTI